MGKRFEDTTLQTDMKNWPFEVIDCGNRPTILITYKGETKMFTPEEVNFGQRIKLFEIMCKTVCFTMFFLLLYFYV